MESMENNNQFGAPHKPDRNKNTSWNILVVSLAVILAFYIGVAWGKKSIQKASDTVANGPSESVSNFLKNLSNPQDLFENTETNKPGKVDFDIFWTAWDKMDKKYVDQSKLDPENMVYGAIKGMVASIGDPYSGFMDPEETNEFNIEMEGSFDGIGAELGIKDGVLTVVAPIEGTPAKNAGIRAGDKILKIDGEITSDMSVEDAVKRIRGKKGTEVTLTIVRNGESKTQDITIKRDRIEIKSIIYDKKEGGIAHIRITKFAEDTTKEFNKAVAQAIADGTKGIIVDVRNNPGGFLDVAVDIASKFMPKGEVVVWEQGRDGEKKEFRARGGDSLSEVPVVVLMNEGSASASEILAGALRDVKKAKLIGKKSFGKGSVQQLEKLSDGSSLRITIAKWLTPSGQSIHEVGLSADLEVEMTEDDFKNNRDPQLDKAIEELKNIIQ